VLFPGDQIIEADGHAITHQGTLRSLILSHSPGDLMPLKVRRDGAEIETELALGSFADLDGPGSPRTVDLLGAWHLRRARLGDTRGPVIEPQPLPVGEAPVPEPGSREWDQLYATGDAPESLVIGGQARQSAALSLAELSARDEALARASADLGPGQGDLERQLVWFRSQRVAMAQTLASLEARLAAGDLSAVDRQNLQRDILSIRESLGRYDEQIRALDAAIRANIPRR
jgi:hypothetical protein